MSQKRVAVVLASLVGTMTISAGALLLMEGGALGTNVPAMGVAAAPLPEMLEPSVPLQSKAWNYIIIYESADVSARADMLTEGLATGGNGSAHNSVRPQGNFHFAIDGVHAGENGVDGKLKVGSSWQQQETGAPYAGWPDPRSYLYTPYTNAIGICLVADISRKPVSAAQHQSLLSLVRHLQERFNIRKEEVLFQWDRRLNAHPVNRAQQAFDTAFHSQLN